MTNEAKVVFGLLGLAGGCGYVGYLHQKINKISQLVDVAVDNLADTTDIQINESLLTAAVQRAVDKEVHYVSKQIAQESLNDLRTQVKLAVGDISSTMKKDIARELAQQVKRIDITDIEKEVINDAKDAVAEKFDKKLDGILDDFNDNLNNIQKIYSSIAKSMSKE